jgi:membrane associated rhomboid family serine protease
VADDRGAGRVAWGARWRAGWLSISIAIVCIVVFVAVLGACAAGSERPGSVVVDSFLGLTSCRATFESFGALAPGRVWVDGEWWRVATTSLLHGSWLHLALNVGSLWSVGVWAEAAWGRLRTLGLFLVASVGGGLGSMAWAEAPLVVGASAGVLGIAGGLLVGRLIGRGATADALRPISPIVLGTMLLVLFGVGFVVPVIAQAGHVGGFAAGVAVTYAGLQRGWMRWAVAAIVGFGLVQLADIAGHPDARIRYHEFIGFRHLDRGEHEAALAAFDRALERSQGDPRWANAVAYQLSLEGRALDRADVLVDLSLAAEPENVDYLDTKGWIACRRGDPDTGMKWLRDAEAALAPGDALPDEVKEHLETCGGSAVAETP